MKRKKYLGPSYRDDLTIFGPSGALHPDMEALMNPKPASSSEDGEEAATTLANQPDPVSINPDEITLERLSRTRVLMHPRWACLSRGQYKFSCGISSLTSVFNFLHSRIGKGSLPPLTQEMALLALGFAPPFSGIRFGPFTGNATLRNWYGILCQKCGVEGSCGFVYKKYGPGRTPISSTEAHSRLCKALASDTMAVVYHLNNHYNVPIGYDMTHMDPRDAYRGLLEGEAPVDKTTWVIIGDPSKTTPPIRSLKWSFINDDLSSTYPDFYDARHPELGLQNRRDKKKAKERARQELLDKEQEARTKLEEAGVAVDGEVEGRIPSRHLSPRGGVTHDDATDDGGETSDDDADSEVGGEADCDTETDPAVGEGGPSLAELAPPLAAHRNAKTKPKAGKKPRNIHALMYFSSMTSVNWDKL
ncbi:basic immunoglobulin-like variable motif-containing protein isoform X2 [Carpediemonas membranifera]|uniref:Basic immunoglobulin-like variable motif-containing protein isoform X2 n=1 Tax=Carpediemonas membranifera TaxID=201153 RepID=A0A8J6E074_9EUKA|nr:basic immunoglobulin-like variable motif-containing protein isoform X2 [Carpediemonas membranifera]|eukprot:KAG9391391.1 basic immunoglobulin-like variable motif-containing protein isoform X2 [Carpediemonas membranifera]